MKARPPSSIRVAISTNTGRCCGRTGCGCATSSRRIARKTSKGAAPSCDVENYKRYLESTALKRKIAGVHASRSDILDEMTAPALGRRVSGRQMLSARRHGKHLFARLDDGAWLTFHFGMTGNLKLYKSAEDEPEYERLRFDFMDGHRLAFIDRRMLARAGATDDPDAYIEAHGLGPDALALAEKDFAALIAKRKGQAKSALMDQGLIAGIGNVFSDEILFQAGLHPQANLDRLSAKQVRTLYKSVQKVLKEAVDRGAGSEDFADRLPARWLIPQRAKGGRCPRGHGEVKSLKFSGRTAYFCPACQPLDS